jgi:hypothetical protein
MIQVVWADVVGRAHVSHTSFGIRMQSRAGTSRKTMEDEYAQFKRSDPMAGSFSSITRPSRLCSDVFHNVESPCVADYVMGSFRVHLDTAGVRRTNS